MVTALLDELDRIIDSLPKEGQKATVVLSTINSLREVALAAQEIREKVQCVASAIGECNSYCFTKKCSKMTMMKTGEQVVISKYKNKTFSLAMTNNSIEVKTADAKLAISPGKVIIELPSSGDQPTVVKEVSIRDFDETFKNNFMLKNTVKKVLSKLRPSITSLNDCAKRHAVVC